MKSSSTKGKILILIVGILLILSLNFFQKEVKGFFYSVSSPIQKSLWGAGGSVSDFFGGIFKAGDLKKENEELQLANEALLSEVVFLQGLEKENETLREALEIGLERTFRLTFAEIIGKDIDQDSFIVDQGLKDGIAKGMPVVTQQKVLLGKVVEVYDDFSRISLISNKESSFDAKISDTNISGVAKGQGSLKVCLDLIPQDKNVGEGDLVISTSMGGIYPKGLLAGIVKTVQKSDIKPFQQIEISPFFDIKALDNVFIILNF